MCTQYPRAQCQAQLKSRQNHLGRPGGNIIAALEDGLLHHVNSKDKILFQLGVVPRTILCGCIGVVQQIIEVNPDSVPLLLSVVMLCICHLHPQGNQFIVGLLKAV